MNGIELITAIRENPNTKHLPCIAITAFHTTVVKQQAIEAGFDSYMAKPLDDTSFLRMVDNMLSA